MDVVKREPIQVTPQIFVDIVFCFLLFVNLAIEFYEPAPAGFVPVPMPVIINRPVHVEVGIKRIPDPTTAVLPVCIDYTTWHARHGDPGPSSLQVPGVPWCGDF